MPAWTPTARWARRGLRLRKPVIATVEGHAVAGGLELALWCDLRVAGSTVRLPRLIGESRARGLRTLQSGESVSGARHCSKGIGRRGQFGKD